MRIQLNLLNIQDTKRMELGVSCFRAILKDTKKKKKTEIVTKQSFKLFNQEAFLNDLSLIPFITSYIFDDPDDVYCCWDSLYNQLLNDHASELNVIMIVVSLACAFT